MKQKIKLISIGLILGLIISSGIVYAVTLYQASEVAYDNSNSGTDKTEVQSAIDELYSMAENHCPENYECIEKKSLIDLIKNNLCTSDSMTECYKEEGNEYIYTGKSGTIGNNYLWYGGHLWRIIKVDKTTEKYTLITSYPVTAIHWQSSITNGPSLEESYVGDWLNNVFIASLPSSVQSKLQNMTYTRKVYNGSNVVSEEISNVKARLLTESEYTTYGGKDSYLDIKDNYFLADIFNSSSIYYVYYDGTLTYYGLSSERPPGIRVVIETSDIIINNGYGSLTVPYVVNTSSNVEIVSDIAVGEYISVPKSDGGTYLARVVKHDQNGAKVVLNGLYTTSAFGSNVTFSVSSTIYTGALTNFKNSLDSTYFDSTNRDFNMTTSGNGSNYASTTTMFNGNIGLPSVGEMFTGNDIEVASPAASLRIFVDTTKIENFTINSYYCFMNAYDSTHSLYINYRGILDINSPNMIFGVRPTWYIKDVEVTGGNGTANDPYTLK